MRKMSDSSKTKDFPDLSSKLSAPTKKSLFERQKAEAEAKRAREEAATAAVYEDFVKSFDDDDGGAGERSGARPAPPSASYGLGPGKRHFTSTIGRSSGPGSLGPVPQNRSSGPGSLGLAPSTFNRKRGYDDSFSNKRSHGMFSYNDPGTREAFKPSDDEDERTAESRAEDRAAAKPTIQLLSLPPGISQAAIKALIPPVLTVDNVRITTSQTPSGQNTERKSSSVIVTLAKETPASDIDTVVNTLQNRYMGFGHYLSISRHLSSAVVNTNLANISGYSAGGNMPFGARPLPQVGSLNRAPPPSHRGFAPPTSYDIRSARPNAGLQVTVQPPSDLKQLKLIHKTLEALLTHGPEFEALLMSRPSVQKEEKWAWLWNARSSGGVYYRWKLYDLVTSSGRPQNRVGGDTQFLFDKAAAWLPPDQSLRYEYTTEMSEFVSDPDYDSSDEEDYEDRRDHENQNTGGLAQDGDLTAEGKGYLTPIAKAKLVHLLARLPESNSKLRKGDIARITAFAIDHAGAGADEVVNLIISNVLLPFRYTEANPDLGEVEKEEADARFAETEGRDGTPTTRMEGGKMKRDSSSASLVGLYVISDILSSSSTSGVRHAWRYRSLFEAGIKQQSIFEVLGRMDRELQWGKLKADKWKRSIQAVLSLWEGWCVVGQLLKSSTRTFTN